MLSGVLPVHLPPATASRTLPTCRMPAIVGTAELAGRIARIELVGSEVAVVAPRELAAVTASRTVFPIWLSNRPSVVAVAPEISLQLAPEELQRNLGGYGDQDRKSTRLN